MESPDSTAATPPRVALPETRQLDVLAQLLERRGLAVVRCPMIAIRDAPDAGPVVEWIRRAIAQPFDLLVVYTGEGVDRLLGFAASAGLEAELVEALSRTPILTRGPKPVRALRKRGLKPSHEAASPTTDGVIATLATLELSDKRIGVQLYGAEPNEPLMRYLHDRGIEPDCVAPYVYASASDEDAVAGLIREIVGGRLDAIAFTSKAQVERLEKVATRLALVDALEQGLKSLTVAAIGPVCAAELAQHGIRVDVMPERDFFMKPLVTELVRRLGPGGGPEASGPPAL